MRFALFIACSLAIFQQITGASILTMYMPTIFQDAGYPQPERRHLPERHHERLVRVLHGRRPGCRRSARPKAAAVAGHAGNDRRHGAVGVLFHWQATGMYVFSTMALVMGAYLVSLAPLDVADHVGDLPQPPARQGDGRGFGVRLDRVVPGDLLLSPDGGLLQNRTSARRPWPSGSMPAFRLRRFCSR